MPDIEHLVYYRTKEIRKGDRKEYDVKETLVLQLLQVD
jgi:hypothetical protein